MKVEFVMVADAAQVADGKLYVLGGAWNLYRCAAFPMPVQMGIVISILVDWEETATRHAITITLADDAGVPILPPMQGQLEVGRPDDLHAKSPQRTVVAISTSIQLPRAGRYTVAATAGNSTESVWFDAIFVGKRLEMQSGGSMPGH
jgi:uncharacterized protein DUF6941